jgi:glycosyltransferase involved in cell wall biosynthesis
MGVDTEYFQPTGARPADNELVLSGAMDWMPNADGVTYFTEAILPRIAATISGVTLTVVGRNPPPTVIAIGNRVPQVRITGAVPDVRPFLERARVFVAPLRVGGGVRLEILEAKAMERAIVTTSLGVDHLPVEHGEHLLIADTPAEFAEAVVRLLKDPEYAQQLGAQASALVRTRFGWNQAAAQFADACLELIGAPARHELAWVQ